MKKGFRYYVELGPCKIKHEPYEHTFDTLKECEKDALESKFTRDMIGIDYCKEDEDGWVEVVLNIIKPKGYLHEEGFTYYDEEEKNKKST